MSYDGAPDRTRAAKQAASAVADVARDEGRDVAGELKTQASDVVDQTKERARDVLGDVRQQARQRVDEQGTRAAATLHDTGRRLHAMADADDELLGDLARRAAGAVDEFATRLDRGGVDQIVDDVKSFARRRPGMFLLGAGVAGFALGRIARNASAALGEQQEAPGMRAPRAATAPLAEPALPGMGEAAAGPGTTEPYLGGATPPADVFSGGPS